MGVVRPVKQSPLQRPATHAEHSVDAGRYGQDPLVPARITPASLSASALRKKAEKVPATLMLTFHVPLAPASAGAQAVCDHGVDRVNDGLIDLNGITYQELDTVAAAPEAACGTSPETIMVGVTEVGFTRQRTGGVNAWAWDFDTIPPLTSNIGDPTVPFPAMSGVYPAVLVMTNEAGGYDTLRAVFNVGTHGDLTMPDAISPHGGPVNDVFKPIGDHPVQWPPTVLNRWGLQAFTTISVTKGWSGVDAAEVTHHQAVKGFADQGNPLRSGYVALLRR